MDVKRLGVCAAFALAIAAMCASAGWGVYTKDFITREDFTAGVGQRVEYSDAVGGVSLVKASVLVPFLWVPSAEDGVVCKADARTGAELGRYRVGAPGEDWTPTAVVSDLAGSAYVLCASGDKPGRVLRISAGNSSGFTSTDVTGDGRISTFETADWGTDAQVTVLAEVGGADCSPSSLVFDTHGSLWVSLSKERCVVRVDVSTGQTKAIVPVQGKPSDLLVDGQGFLWVLCREARVICKVDTLVGAMAEFFPLGDCKPAGMCFDSRGRICMGNALGGLIELDPATGAVTTQELGIDNAVSAVTVDRDGDLWATMLCRNEIWRFNSDYEFVEAVPVGCGPSSVCCDDDGYLWVLNRFGASATRVDPRTSKAVLNVRTCDEPFSSTPFAASVVKRGMSPDGEWRAVLDGRIAGAGWGKVAWDVIKSTSQVEVYVRSAEVMSALADSQWQRVNNDERFSIPNGRYMEVRVALKSRAGMSPILKSLSVEGTNLPPDISKATPSLARIPRDEGKMEPVEITGVKDPEGGPVEIKVTGVTQDEPTSGLFDTDIGPDAMGIGSATVWLRGECGAGSASKSANGRVYTISYVATDALGASTKGTVKVEVPTVYLPECRVVDDGQRYDSAKTMLQTAAEDKRETSAKG